jgi:hypothetical protein
VGVLCSLPEAAAEIKSGPLEITMKFARNESGQSLVMSALCITVLLGFVGFGIDIGLLFHAKRNLQTAADAAAIAGALNPSSYAASGAAAAAANGVTATTQPSTLPANQQTTVTINCPPAKGPFSSAPNCATSGGGFVEALIQQPSQTFFMGLFGFNNMEVAARAVAGPMINSGCVYTLMNSASLPGGFQAGLQLSGGSTNITATSCDIYSNANISLSGGASISAKYIGDVGGYSANGGSTASPAPQTISAISDPLANVTAPTVPGSCTNVINNVSGTFSQGCYTGITVSGGDVVNLNPGTYVVNGNLTVQGSSATLTCTGCTFYVTGQITFSGGTGIDISAPTSGQYPGILLFQSRTDTQQATVSGGSGGTINGIIYVPDAGLLFSGGSGGTLNTVLVAGALQLTGGSNLSNYNQPGSVLSKAVLVE